MTGRAIAASAIVCALVCADAAAASPPLRAVASLQPAAVQYGDPVTAVVEVDFDRKAIAPSSIRVQPSFVPYVVTSGPIVKRVRDGVVRFTYSLLCVTDGCLPIKSPRLVQLQPVTVSSTNETATARWPALRVSSRLASGDLSGAIRFRNPATPPAASYRLAPGTLAGALVGVAALCVLIAAALVAHALRRRSASPIADRRSPLELAIAYVRDSARRSDADRRRALELLAEAVGRPDVAAAAAETAWSEQPPTPARTTELAEQAAHVK